MIGGILTVLVLPSVVHNVFNRMCRRHGVQTERRRSIAPWTSLETGLLFTDNRIARANSRGKMKTETNRIQANHSISYEPGRKTIDVPDPCSESLKDAESALLKLLDQVANVGESNEERVATFFTPEFQPCRCSNELGFSRYQLANQQHNLHFKRMMVVLHDDDLATWFQDAAQMVQGFLPFRNMHQNPPAVDGVENLITKRGFLQGPADQANPGTQAAFVDPVPRSSQSLSGDIDPYATESSACDPDGVVARPTSRIEK